MFQNIENLKLESIHKGTAKKQNYVSGRKTNSFILRITGTVRYTFPECSFDVRAGEVIFLPKGACYETKVLTDEPCTYVVINFEADITGALPFKYSLDGFQETEEITNNLADWWKFGTPSEHYKCYHIFYSLLEYMENLKNRKYADTKKLDIILPAVTYLKKNIYNCNLRVAVLADLCGISVTYFQKIFQANFASSPQKYIMGKRLQHAKILFDNGDFENISDVALSVGYSDPLYFSRAFRKKYGLSPSLYIKSQRVTALDEK